MAVYLAGMMECKFAILLVCTKFVNRDPADDSDIDTRQTLGPVTMMTMRIPVAFARMFKHFCKTNRYSYWEGIVELMNRAGV